jgi:hypothetical protein
MPTHLKGSCLCGVVTFSVSSPLGDPVACHCSKCRKSSGHYDASTSVPKTDLVIAGFDKITWFQSSEKVRRGFCSCCGSRLFFEPVFRDWIGISMGAFDELTQVKLAMHIFVADKGDYYDLTDGLPQNQQ